MGAGFDTPKELIDKVGTFADKQISNTLLVGQDTIRQTGTVIDNIRSDGFSVARQYGSDTAALIDSLFDNGYFTFSFLTVSFLDTFQASFLLTVGGIILFFMFFGEKIFANGIRLGKINLF